MINRLERWLTSRPLTLTLPAVVAALMLLAVLVSAGVSFTQSSAKSVDRADEILRTRLNSLQGTIELMLQIGLESEVQQIMVDLYTDPRVLLAVVADERLNAKAANREQWTGRPLTELLAALGFDAPASGRILATVRLDLTA
jgi:predicted PurR-regulated permease PerM